MAKQSFEENHSTPKISTLTCDTEVTNKGKTSNRHPNGDFGNSWMKYWMAFPKVSPVFVCSVDGEPIWVEDDKDSCEKCRAWNRMFN